MQTSIKRIITFCATSLAVLLMLTALIAIGVFTFIHFKSARYIYTDLASLPHTQVAVIPGAAILKDGDLSPVLKDRANTAIALYDAKKVDKILISGNNSTLQYNEVAPVRDYLFKHGIPLGDIFLDYAGFDTYSTLYRSQSVFKIQSMTIVSQSFHLPRAVYIARALGMDAYAMNADNGHYLFYNYIREIFADVKACINLLFHRQPKFLGKAIPIMGNTNSITTSDF